MEVVMLLLGALISVIVMVIFRPATHQKSVGVLIVEQVDSENCMFQLMFNDFQDIVDKRQITLDVTHISHK